jgi:hypothetical protein
MTAKLTLSIDAKIIERAKIKAKKEGKSLSAMVEDYLAFSVQDVPYNKSEYIEKVEKLAGSLKMKLPKDFDIKKDKQSRLLKKYYGV